MFLILKENIRSYFSNRVDVLFDISAGKCHVTTYFCFRMSGNASPARYIESEDYLSDANFKADINRKMRVPHKISMSGYENEMPNGLNSNWSNNYSNMQVPERILVAGQDQHIGDIRTYTRGFYLF